ncbi:MAG: hypothetical protein J1E62_10150 [Lachnospiraceae bacterium]|nr:hypothetical protein [Lachnospiraceae bacterium]
MDLIGKNGKIDGILAAQVLLDGGVFFFKPGELYYDGTYHQIRGMQANTAAMRDYPGIFDKMDALAPELVNLMVYIEKNVKFRVKVDDLGQEIRQFLQNEDMTGMTFLYLFKWHLLALNRTVAGITAAMESRVRACIPEAEDKVRELIEMLVAYNGADPKSVAITVVEVNAQGKVVQQQQAAQAPAPVAPTAAPAAVEQEQPATGATQVNSIVGTTVSDSGAMDPVAAPSPTTTAASPMQVAQAASAALPADFSSYADSVKPKLQKVATEWEQYLAAFKNQLATVQFTGFSDPKIKELRDSLADKQEDFGAELEEILDDLYEHIDALEAKGVPENEMKSVLDLERDCYEELKNLRANFDYIGDVEYRISRRCSRNHERWDEVYKTLPSVLRVADEEKKNVARRQIEVEINEIREKINVMVKNYNDAKAVVEYAQQQIEASKGNAGDDRKKLMARADAAVGAVDERIRENNMRIEEMEIENRRLEDELKDISGFALGRKKTIRDTIEYNNSYIEKYRSVGQNLERERQQVAEEWNEKLEGLSGDTGKLQEEIAQNTEKMKQLEQSVAAEKQNLAQKEAELAKLA